MLAQELIEQLGYKCKVLSNGKEAVEAVKKQRSKYLLIFMDWEMPVMDGLTASKQIRVFEQQNNLMNAIPIVALTAHVDQQEIKKCFKAGMNDTLSKPFLKQELK